VKTIQVIHHAGAVPLTRRPSEIRVVDEGIISEYEGGLMTGRMIAKFDPSAHPNLQ
jgi:hypothetical protein